MSDGRRYAELTLSHLNELHQTLEDGVRLNDANGIVRLVINPLNQMANNWPSTYVMHADDQRKHFDYCRAAISDLQTLAYSFTRKPTLEEMQNIRRSNERYVETIQGCEKNIATTDSQIKKKLIDDEKALEKFGGQECLTVYGVRNGETIELPKPAHCPKRQ